MKDSRIHMEKTILTWPDVRTKKMFGCPCYIVKDVLFAFLVTGGIVITDLDDEDREKLSKTHRTKPFHAGKRTVQKWIQVSIKGKNELDSISSFIRKSYESARK